MVKVSLTHTTPSESIPVLFNSDAVQNMTSPCLPEGQPQQLQHVLLVLCSRCCLLCPLHQLRSNYRHSLAFPLLSSPQILPAGIGWATNCSTMQGLEDQPHTAYVHPPC